MHRLRGVHVASVGLPEDLATLAFTLGLDIYGVTTYGDATYHATLLF